MNLNKLTKAELVSKFKKLDLKNSSNKNQSISSKIIENILLLKSIILKITLIALIVKIFKKYSIFRRIWTVINTIVMSIFGISLLDNFGIEAINNCVYEIRSIGSVIVDYITSTQFYTYIASFFKAKEEVTKTGGPQSKKKKKI